MYEMIDYSGIIDDFYLLILERESELKCSVYFKIEYLPERLNTGKKYADSEYN